MCAIFVLIFDRKTEIDQVNNRWVIQSDQDVFWFDIIMDISKFMNLSDPFNLYRVK